MREIKDKGSCYHNMHLVSILFIEASGFGKSYEVRT